MVSRNNVLYEFDWLELKNMHDQFDKQTLTDHLRDLRSCLVFSLAAVVFGFVVSYSFYPTYQRLVFQAPDEGSP